MEMKSAVNSGLLSDLLVYRDRLGAAGIHSWIDVARGERYLYIRAEDEARYVEWRRANCDS